MSVITSKKEINKILSSISTTGNFKNDVFIKEFHTKVLKKKIKFPLLEYIAVELYKIIPEKDQITVTNNIINLQEIGSNVVAGMILQLRLKKHFSESIQKAIDYIIHGNQWYVCDIIGERVMGHALLTDPEKAIPVLKKNTQHQDKWIVRSVGVATHYAVKKGLSKKHAEEMFVSLLSLANTTELHTKKGIGWAAKTTAKFYPSIINKYKIQIDNNTIVKQWFRTKIKIGLGRSSKYASRDTGKIGS